jgi:hypothetical protein
MHLGLRFATDIIRPWERLNQELINQNSIDSEVSDFINNATNLAVKLSHFGEVAGRKDIRTNKKSIPFNIIVDLADAIKHNDVNPDRNTRLYISSLFEGTEEGAFRFIRNSIKVTHNKYGLFDFLQISKEAANFVLTNLNLIIYWNPPLLEAPPIFSDKVFLGVYFEHQITWTGLNIEFFKRNDIGELVHYDPPSWLFELRSPLAINTHNYYEYIVQLLRRSIASNSTLIQNPGFKLQGSSSEENFVIDVVIIQKVHLTEVKTVVKIVNSEEISLGYLQELEIGLRN